MLQCTDNDIQLAAELGSFWTPVTHSLTYLLGYSA